MNSVERDWRRWLWPLRSRKIQVALVTVVVSFLAQAGIVLSEETVLSVLGVGALLFGLRAVKERVQDAGDRLRLYGAAALAYGVFVVVMYFAHPANPDPVPVPIDLLELFRTLTMVGQFLIWALMAAGATAGLYWYQRRDEKAGNRFDPVTGAPVRT